MLPQERINYWLALRDEMFANTEFQEQRLVREAKRPQAVDEMNDLLSKYLGNNIGNADFRSTYQAKTPKEWDVFGLRGFSGAMFLNMLVNNIPDQAEVAKQLRTVLPIPSNAQNSYQKLREFIEYLQRLVHAGIVAKRNLQIAHAPFFVSSWWHVQNLDNYPIFYISTRNAFINTGIYTPEGDDLAKDYFTFREIFLFLKQELGLNTWEMERLGVWHEERNTYLPEPEVSEKISEIVPVQIIAQPTESKAGGEERVHTRVQWLLAKIGHAFNYTVWIAANDHKRTWEKEPLGRYSIPELPRFNGVGPKSQRMIELIDVVWLKRQTIVAAFEIEGSTSIYSGLLRMSDLSLALPNFVFPLYIVVPETRIEEVKAQLLRLTFQHLGLHQRCRFFTFEKLIEDANPIMQYASDATAINRIAHQVPEINPEDYF